MSGQGGGGGGGGGAGAGGPKSLRWGSLLSQAVAGVEARLDNILAEDDPANKTGQSSAPSQQSKPSTPTPGMPIPSPINMRWPPSYVAGDVCR